MSNKFNRRSIRLKGYDYSQEGLYFITICCQDRICRFGKVVNGKMILNETGKIAKICWLQIPEHFTNVVLHEFVIMPNHIHGIIEITVGANQHLPLTDIGINDISELANQHLPLTDIGINDISELANQHLPQIEGAKDFSPQRDSPPKGTSKTIGSIIRGFKIGVTKWVRQNTDIQDFWQRNYYERIIRNEKAYQNISQYIQNNPLNWGEDKFHF